VSCCTPGALLRLRCMAHRCLASSAHATACLHRAPTESHHRKVYRKGRQATMTGGVIQQCGTSGQRTAAVACSRQAAW
jgi:hypothetical protein